MDQKLIESMRVKRLENHLSIRKLAQEIGVSFSALARLERGLGVPDNNTKARILTWLGDDAKDLGFDVQHVANVHFRAAKNAPSKTIECLVKVAAAVRKQLR